MLQSSHFKSLHLQKEGPEFLCLPNYPMFDFLSWGRDSFLQEIVPIELKGNPYPAPVLFRWRGNGSQPSPIQVLAHQNGRYVDTTDTAFFTAAGNTMAARNCVVADFRGCPGIFIADQRLIIRHSPALITLLLSTPDGHLIKATATLPQAPGFSHDVSAGMIGDNSNVAIFINNVSNIEEGLQPPQLLMSNEESRFNDISSRLPPTLINRSATRYTASALVDLRGHGRADLVLGTMDAMSGASIIYLNPGNGDFSQVVLYYFALFTPFGSPSPYSPAASSAGHLTKDMPSEGAATLDIQPTSIGSWVWQSTLTNFS